MKKIITFFAVVVCLNVTSTMAQNTTFNNVSIGTDGPAYGIKIKANFPGLNSAWARGYYITNETGTQNYIAFGSLGTVANGVTSIANSFIGTDYNNQFMTFLPNGNIGIGTQIPDEKLTIKGKIHTQEVRVDMAGPLVPDYVFENDYKLKSLQEVENYIKENKHLPEIPSALEIEKNGLMLAEMNMILLKKMEEMTLYIIEQNKKIENLEKKLETILTK